MTITEHTTVGDIAAAMPSSVRATEDRELFPLAAAILSEDLRPGR
jgi:hypothetical protein